MPWQSSKDRTGSVQHVVVNYSDRGVREHLPRNDDHAVNAVLRVVVLEVPGRPRSGKLPQSGTGGRERATDRKAAFSKSVTLLSLIEGVMSNLTGVELVQCS